MDLSDPNAPEHELMAVPRLADALGVTPRVFRYWVEQGLVSPSREHGKLRFAPHDLEAARQVKRLLDAGVGIDGVRMLRELAERRVAGALAGDERDVVALALSMLYERKAFRERAGTDPQHYPDGPSGPPTHGPHRPAPPPAPRA